MKLIQHEIVIDKMAASHVDSKQRGRIFADDTELLEAIWNNGIQMGFVGLPAEETDAVKTAPGKGQTIVIDRLEGSHVYYHYNYINDSGIPVFKWGMKNLLSEPDETNRA